MYRSYPWWSSWTYPCDICQNGPMTDHSLKHSTTLAVSLECFDYYQEFVLTFHFQYLSGCALPWLKTFLITKFSQTMNISHDITRTARKTQEFRSSGDLSSYVKKSCHAQHVYIHTSLNHSLPFTVCMALTFFLCRKSAPKVSHSSCTRSSWPYRAASRTAVQPSWGKGAIVDFCDTTNRRGVSGVRHKAFRKSRLLPTFDIETLIQFFFLLLLLY